MMKNLPIMWRFSTFNFLGEGVYRSSIPIIAMLIESDPSSVGISITASKLPWLFTSVIVGAAIDRYTAVNIMRLGLLIRIIGLIFLMYLIINKNLTFSLFLIISFVIATGDVITELTIQTSIPAFTHPSELPKANARIYGIQMLAGQLSAPIISSSLIYFGFNYLILFLIIIQIVSIGHAPSKIPAISKIPVHFQSTSEDSYKAILQDKKLKGIFVSGAIMMAAYGAWSSAFALYAVDTSQGLGITKSQYGLAISSIAIGALIGSITIPRLKKVSNEFGLICFASGSLTLLPTICLLFCSKSVVMAALVLYGASLSAWTVAAVSYRHRIVPSRMLGRINGLYRMCSWGAMPMGALLGAFVTSNHGYSYAFLLATIISCTQIFTLNNMRRTDKTIL